MTLLVIDDVHKVYAGVQGGVSALRGVSFCVEPGDWLAIRGPSGCGKSTLLHLVGAMDRPTQGHIRLRNQNLSALAPEELAQVRRRQIGFVFQAFNLFPTLSVLENVMLPLLLDGQARRAAQNRADGLLEQVGLAHRATHFPAQLSGGEMQRVAVARAVAARPDLLLADEPTGSLDTENGQRVLELLAEVHRTQGAAILLATHSAEAAAFASRTLFLRDGRVVAE